MPWTIDAVNEETTPIITGIIKDNNGDVVPGAAITEFRMSLISYDDASIINDRDNIDIKASGEITIDNAGAFEIQLTVEDTTKISTAELEMVVAELSWKWNAGNNTGRDKIYIPVRNYKTVGVG